MVHVHKIRFQPTGNTLLFHVTPNRFLGSARKNRPDFGVVRLFPAANQVVVVRPSSPQRSLPGVPDMSSARKRRETALHSVACMHLITIPPGPVILPAAAGLELHAVASSTSALFSLL
jgi:hypothetical protein